MKFLINGKSHQLAEVERLDSVLARVALTLYRTVKKFVFLRDHLLRIGVEDVRYAVHQPRIEITCEFGIGDRHYFSGHRIDVVDLHAGTVAAEHVAFDLCRRVATMEEPKL